MGAFCVFGISRAACQKKAEKVVPVKVPGAGGRSYSPVEWGGLVREAAVRLFEEATRRERISPELDAPQFCRDWLAAQPGEVREAVIMCRGQKFDKGGAPVMRKGAPVMTWLVFDESAAQARPFGEAA